MAKHNESYRSKKGNKSRRGRKLRSSGSPNPLHEPPGDEDLDGYDSDSDGPIEPLFPEGWIENHAGEAARHLRKQETTITQEELAVFRKAAILRSRANNDHDELEGRLLFKLDQGLPVEPGLLKLLVLDQDPAEMNGDTPEVYPAADDDQQLRYLQVRSPQDDVH